MKIGCDDEHRDQPCAAVQRRGCKQGKHAGQRASGEQHEKARRKNTGCILRFLHRKAEHRVGDAERKERDEQIRRLRDEVRRAVVGGAQIFRVKAHHEEHEQLRAECAEPELHRISRQPLIFAVHTKNLFSNGRCHCRRGS